MQNFLTVEQLDEDKLMVLIKRALAFKNGEQAHYSANVMNLFFENSTRTKISFNMAESKLGMTICDFNVGTSSVQKGESLYDTIRTVEEIGMDIVVIRHSDAHYYEKLKKVKLHIVNGGSGNGQHPSQSLLDMMTIYEEYKTFQDLNVAIIGDLSHSRVAMSNAMLLKSLGAHLIFSGPDFYYNDRFDSYGRYLPIDEAIEKADIVMMLRVQNERLKDGEVKLSKEDYFKTYGLTVERSKRMQKNAIIMHPAPVNRDVELADELVEAPQSRIFKQMHNGVFARMAILEDVMKGN